MTHTKRGERCPAKNEEAVKKTIPSTTDRWKKMGSKEDFTQSSSLQTYQVRVKASQNLAYEKKQCRTSVTHNGEA